MTRTVHVIMGGGLGNQLFMYAAGRALAHRIGGRLRLDLSEFPRDHVYKRVALLDRFPITAEPSRKTSLTPLLWTADRLVRKCRPLASRLGLFDEPLADGLPVFDPRLLAPPRTPFLSLRGYWQSERYFSDAAALIRQELSPPKPDDHAALHDLETITSAEHPVAVGIRFFRETPTGGLDPGHTLAAFRKEVAAHAVALPGCRYFVFTDEPANLSDPQCLGVPFTLMTPRPRNEDAPVDLFLMARCRTFFIGYSSFHWWAAWLADAPNKRVTYLHFPGRPCEGYAAEGWATVPVSPR